MCRLHLRWLLIMLALILITIVHVQLLFNKMVYSLWFGNATSP